MPEIKIVTEVAGRVCAIPVTAGASIADGDEVAFVEAMKMEIPVMATASGIIKSILVTVDEIVAEGQAVAIVET
jgi:biotin carboxyl carrier protein